MMQKNNASLLTPHARLMFRPHGEDKQPPSDETQPQNQRAPPPTAVPLSLSTPDREWLERFGKYIRQCIADDTLSVPGMANQFAMSESTLLRQLKRLTGLTPVQYLVEVRLAKARHLLENRACDSVAQVASRVGYADPRSFSRAFRQRFGKLPSEV